jgi:tripartite-type tricarboxylate transporter receptor subunit TctC
VSAALSLIQSGKLRPLTVSSPERAASLPNVPTSLEAGYPDSAYRFWLGVFAPAGTPPAIVTRLNGEIEKALQVPEVRVKLEKLGVQPMRMNVGEFTQFVKDELAANADLAKRAGIAAQ